MHSFFPSLFMDVPYLHFSFQSKCSVLFSLFVSQRKRGLIYNPMHVSVWADIHICMYDLLSLPPPPPTLSHTHTHAERNARWGEIMSKMWMRKRGVFLRYASAPASLSLSLPFSLSRSLAVSLARSLSLSLQCTTFVYNRK